MSTWDAANNLEEMAHKLAHARDAIELVAENVDSPYSGALWAVYCLIDNLQDKMYVQADKVMELHKEENKLKKAKK
jgi:hypothetical protein